MASDVTRDEFQHLATRTDILEREVEGEKMVTRHILEQTRRNGDDLATLTRKFDDLRREFGDLRGEFADLRGEFGGLRGEFSGLRGEFGGLRGQFAGFRDSLPSIVGDAVREAIEPLIRKRET